jgi:D-glycero-D-manno-heptose 1,7-bisphosphate phosphatase
MLLRAAEELNLDLSTSFMVGDRWRDTEAGRRAGCTTIQIGGTTTREYRPDHVVSTLPEATAIILQGC